MLATYAEKESYSKTLTIAPTAHYRIVNPLYLFSFPIFTKRPIAEQQLPAQIELPIGYTDLDPISKQATREVEAARKMTWVFRLSLHSWTCLRLPE
jgi:hypothetical protein